jgi:hypothetical protein
MFYSVIIGDQTQVNNTWEFYTDDYGNEYFGCLELFQRIRILKKNAKELMAHLYSSANVEAFHLPSFIEFNLSPKNMSISMVNKYEKDEEKRKAQIDPQLVYVTLINKNYKLISADFNMDLEIISTYRKKDTFQGCVLKITKDDIEDLGRIYVFDKEKNRMAQVSLTLKNERVTVEIGEIEDKDLHLEIYEKHKSTLQRNNHFKLQLKYGEIYTTTFVTDDEHEKIAKEISSKYKKSTIIKINPDDKEEDIVNTLKESLAGTNIRALTTVGCRIPFEAIKELKIAYIFDYDLTFKTCLPVKCN